MWAATAYNQFESFTSSFLFTPPVRVATKPAAAADYASAISIHAARAGSDPGECAEFSESRLFLFTPPVRVATF